MQDYEFTHLMETRRWAYWLNRNDPDPNDSSRFRVCVVFERFQSYFLMGDETKGQMPWYWDEETCREQNQERGINPAEASEIVASSIMASRTNRVRRGF